MSTPSSTPLQGESLTPDPLYRLADLANRYVNACENGETPDDDLHRELRDFAYRIVQTRAAPPVGGDQERHQETRIDFATWRVVLTEDGRKVWRGSEVGWKEGAEEPTLTLRAEDFPAGTVADFSAPEEG